MARANKGRKDRIVTKHEWMISALEALEKISNCKKDEPPSVLYDALFIDPTKLTPYQESQLD
jgi:hypothetical protein